MLTNQEKILLSGLVSVLSLGPFEISNLIQIYYTFNTEEALNQQGQVVINSYPLAYFYIGPFNAWIFPYQTSKYFAIGKSSA